ncbi:hypothetical protein DQ384_35465 [Sphaerisporangium album]|uniref:Uncharacterized protein n=1 Tax=Sphaerisporangium album TaxID=509200 RepID=A0A367EWG8_9ACTN|nr:hypothetical protein [Sphaerisporangium album]RCG22423.1 hypothetical protein DQ384_35465 [Sphaerisporangium album]
MRNSDAASPSAELKTRETVEANRAGDDHEARAGQGPRDTGDAGHPAGEIKISVLRRTTLRAGLLAGFMVGVGITIDPTHSTHSTALF